MITDDDYAEAHRQLDRAHAHVDAATSSLHWLLAHRTDRDELVPAFIARWTRDAQFELACLRMEHEIPVHR